jgi:hypothetical protein
VARKSGTIKADIAEDLGINGKLVRSGRAVEGRTRTGSQASPAYRRGFGSSRHRHHHHRHAPTRHVRCSSAANQRCSESALGETAATKAQAHNLSSRTKADRSGAESAVGEGEAREVNYGLSNVTSMVTFPPAVIVIPRCQGLRPSFSTSTTWSPGVN